LANLAADFDQNVGEIEWQTFCQQFFAWQKSLIKTTQGVTNTFFLLFETVFSFWEEKVLQQGEA
jgi:hypothetical protein